MRKENSSGGNLSKVIGYFLFVFIAFIVLKSCVTSIIEEDYHDDEKTTDCRSVGLCQHNDYDGTADAYDSHWPRSSHRQVRQRTDLLHPP